MNETVRFYFITKAMSYLMIIPDMELDAAYEIADRMYDEALERMYHMIESEILDG